MPERDSGRSLDATVRVEGRRRQIEGHGTGPIDAFVDALARTLAVEMEVTDYHEHAVGAGADAMAVAYVEVRAADGRTLFGAGMDKNIVTASLRAVTSAANRMQRKAAKAA